jgi:integrase
MSPRRRTKDKDLPPRVYRHGASYRFVPVDAATGRNAKPVNLGRDKAAALRRWAELVSEHQDDDEHTVSGLWKRYLRDEVPRKAEKTRRNNAQCIRPLLDVFGAMPIAGIEPHHAIRYLDLRGQTAPVQANREIALLRHLLTKATHWGLLPRNPLLGLQYRNPEPPRDRYVTDDELAYAIEHAPTNWLRALLWLAYLTGLRRRDLLALTRFQVQTDGLLVRESKTGKRVLILWTDALKRVVDDCLADSPNNRLFPVTESAVNNAWGRFQRRLAAEGRQRFLLRDLRAKHATDFEDAGGDATIQLGHSARSVTTRHYLRAPRRIIPLR